MRRALLLTPALLALLAAPAQAAEIHADHRCYRVGEKIRVKGAGFTPNGTVSATLQGKPVGRANVDGTGSLSAILAAPQIDAPVRAVTLTTTDEQNPQNQAMLDFRVTRLTVGITPRTGGKPDRRVTFHARGFTGAKTLYVHYLTPHGAVGKTKRLGRVRTQCGVVSAHGPLLPYPNASPGRWRLRFDSHRDYSGSTRPQVRLLVKIRPRG